MMSAMRPLMYWGVPTIMFLVTAFQCGALQLSFFAASLFGICQTMLLRNENFRSMVGMTPLMTNRNAGRAIAVSDSRTVNTTITAPASTSAAPLSSAATVQPASAAEPTSAFASNPFANLQTLPRTPGSTFESGVKYQAPKAQDTLAAAGGDAAGPEEVATKAKPKTNFLKRELDSVIKGGKAAVKAVGEKVEGSTTPTTKKGDKGREAAYLSKARAYEEKMRKSKGGR